MNQTQTNHRHAARALTTTVEQIVDIRRVTLVERGPVWDDRVIYDSTTRPDLTRRQRAKQAVKTPQHRHVMSMWVAAFGIFLGLIAALGTGPEAFAIFAPVIQETFTHWSIS